MTAYEKELARDVEMQSLACIGCNDCLLACPVPESRHVTIGELNNAIQLPIITQQNIIRFTTACTQCQQCVPACPADLSRADMVLFNKLKIEDSVADHELMLQARTVTFPSGLTLDALAARLTELEVFAGAAVQNLRRMLLKSTLRMLVPGEDLCQEGEFHEKLCVVLSGSLEQVSRGPRAELLHILVLPPGSFFGEMGVLADAPEPFTVVARDTSIVLEVPKVAVLRLMELAPTFGNTFQALYARRALWSYAKSPGALGQLPEAALEELLRSATLELTPAGEFVFQAGDTPHSLYLVKSGFLRASQLGSHGERVLTYFREGEVFGVLALVYREPAQPYSVQAVSRAEVIRIPGSALWQVMGKYSAAQTALLTGAFEAERLARARDVGVGPMDMPSSIGRPSAYPSTNRASGIPGVSRSLDGTRAPLAEGVLVEQGILSGREVLVIDQTRCTSCGNCIDACERRHGYSRLQLRGLQVENYMFPTACRHCNDPACLLCSVNGIVRLPSGEIKIVEDNCIGCGACAERCPYGNISMHPVEKPKQGILFSILNFLAGSPLRERSLEELDPKTQRLAVKCDLCAGHSDYACVTACPVAAAFRIDPGRTLSEPTGQK